MDDEIKIKLKELIESDYSDHFVSIKGAYSYAGCCNNIVIKLEKDGGCKYLYYNLKQIRPFTNMVDGVFNYHMHKDKIDDFLGDPTFGNDFNVNPDYFDGSLDTLEDVIMLFSYEIDGKIRAFVGLSNLYLGKSYPVGFDLNKQEFVKFPINELGLIDDKKMKEILNEEKLGIGFDIEEYKEACKSYDISYILRDLLKEDFIYDYYDTMDRILFKLAEYNYEVTKANDKIVWEILLSNDQKRK